MRLVKFLLPALLLFVSALPAYALGQAPTFHRAACPFPVELYSGETEGQTISCGWLTVPEDRANPGRASVQLAVAIIVSTNPSAPKDPIIYLEGGPGGAALSPINFWLNSGLRASRDIILVDQRGTGFSTPSLNCPEIDENSIDDPIKACHDRLVSQGVDLAAYTSAESAADIADLISVLGYNEVNLYGVSYGSRLALTVVRDHPQHVRSVILDGVYPPQVNAYDEQAYYGDRAFQELFDACAADSACNSAYPNLRQVFYDTVDRLNNRPGHYTDPNTGDRVSVYGDDLVNQIYQLLYDPATIPYLPSIIYDASQGVFGDNYIYGAGTFTGPDLADISDSLYDSIMMNYLGYDSADDMYTYLNTLSDAEYYAIEDAAFGYVDDDSEGMFDSVECYEEVPFNSMNTADRLSQRIAPQISEAMLAGVEQQFADCQTWNVPAAPAMEKAPVNSDIPTLVLSGQFDPITPPDWGQAAADHLSHSFAYVFPGMGVGAVDSDPCPTSIALAFLDNPDAAPPSACIGQMHVQFVTGG